MCHKTRFNGGDKRHIFKRNEHSMSFKRRAVNNHAKLTQITYTIALSTTRRQGYVSSKNGVLLINLGTPDSPKVADVRRYLREFLSDARVIDLPWLIRFILVNLLIVPTRAPKSANAYQAIWTPQGSPLKQHSLALTQRVGKAFGPNATVVLGMRYGQPSIASAIETLITNGCQSITVLPLFPQYAESTSGSAIAMATRLLNNKAHTVHVIKDYFNAPAYIEAQATLLRKHLKKMPHKPDLFLFSFHGLPMRHIIKSEKKGVCDHVGPCPAVGKDNRYCYRAQCYATARQLAKKLNLNADDYLVTFQSRLGKTPWIGPATDDSLIKLAKAGHKQLAIACPSFVSDCLETLEEIGLRAQAKWHELTGGTLTLFPCLNDDPQWVSAIKTMVTHRTSLDTHSD